MAGKTIRFVDLIDWKLLLSDNNLASTEEFWSLDSRPHFTIQTVMLHEHLVKLLAKRGIDAENFEIDLLATPPEVIVMVELCIGYGKAKQAYQAGDWESAIAATNRASERANQLLAERRVERAEMKRRSEVSRGGAIAKAQNRRELIEEVIRRFDPGTGTKKSRVATIIKKADEAKVKGREKLPIRLDKYLP